VHEERMPTPNELRYAPELATLAALDATLEAALRVLVAAHPELCEDRLPRANLHVLIRGHRLLHLALKLQVALAHYRQAAAPQRPLPPDATDDLDALSLGDLDTAGSAD
jgi:hypothetical protein